PDTAPDGYDIARGERLRRVVQTLEFWRQLADRQLDLSVDPGDERCHHDACAVVQCICLAHRDLVDADSQVRDVAGQICGAEDLPLAAKRASPQAIHLPQPVLRHREAETEIQIGRAGGMDVRNPGAVAQDLDTAANRAGDLLWVLHDVPPMRD